MTPKMQDLLKDLRGGCEGESIDTDGTRWGQVYVANHVRGRSGAAVLGALQKAGLYRPYDGGDRMYEGVWGKVKLEGKAS